MTTIKKRSTNIILASLISIGLSACSQTDQNNQSDSNHHNSAHSHNYHLGPITPEQLVQQYDIFAQAKQANEQPATTQQIAQLANHIDGKKLKIFFGTWCHDSQREVPRLLNLLEQIKTQHNQVEFELEMVAVAPFELRDKQIVESYNIRYVPTIILYDGTNEIGRIIESAQISLAADLNNMRAK